MEEEIKRIIRECDLAIKREDFDTLLSHYTEDAVLVVKPGLVAKGKRRYATHSSQLQSILTTALSRPREIW